MALKGTASADRFLRGRLRQRRSSRRVYRLWLRWGSALVGLAALVATGFWVVAIVGRAPELMVHRVWVDGNERLSEGEVLQLIDVTEGINILTLDLSDVKEQLLRSTWIKNVDITRVLPATLILHITERTPVGIAVLDELYLIAEDGTILDQVTPHYDVEDLFLVRGLTGLSGVSQLNPEKVQLAGSLAARLMMDSRLASLVSELDVRQGNLRDGVIDLNLRSPAITVAVSEQKMVEQLQAFLPLARGILNSYPGTSRVDLRFQNRMILTMDNLVSSWRGGEPF